MRQVSLDEDREEEVMLTILAIIGGAALLGLMVYIALSILALCTILLVGFDLIGAMLDLPPLQGGTK